MAHPRSMGYCMRKLVFAAALAASPLAAEAVTYQFMFERSYESTLEVIPEAGLFAGSGPYVAQAHAGAPFSPTFELGFSYDGSLDGLVLDIANLDAFADAWSIGWNGEDWSFAGGTIAFSGNEVTDWHISAQDHGGSSHGFFHQNSSQPIPFDEWADEMVNPEALPAAHYGFSKWEPNIYNFALAPGRWICLDGCDEQVAEVVANPIPAPLLLLLSGVAGLFFLRTAASKRRCAA
jgi:hypothetical protein